MKQRRARNLAKEGSVIVNFKLFVVEVKAGQKEELTLIFMECHYTHMGYIVFIIVMLMSIPSAAKPVQWAGGTMLMAFHDRDMDSFSAAYSFDAKNALATRTDYFRRDESFIGGLQWNRLLKRWNMPDAQANIYFKVGAGIASDKRRKSGAAFGGLLADYETRRVFFSYENDLVYGGRVETYAWHSGRAGFAPYIAGYKDINTWIMVQGDYRPKGRERFSLTPFARFFTTRWMIEAGATLRGDGMVNLMWQF